MIHTIRTWVKHETRCIFWKLIILHGLIQHILRDRNAQTAWKNKCGASSRQTKWKWKLGKWRWRKMPWSELFRLVCLHNWIGSCNCNWNWRSIRSKCHNTQHFRGQCINNFVCLDFLDFPPFPLPPLPYLSLPLQSKSSFRFSLRKSPKKRLISVKSLLRTLGFAREMLFTPKWRHSGVMLLSPLPVTSGLIVLLPNWPPHRCSYRFGYGIFKSFKVIVLIKHLTSYQVCLT